MYWLLITVYCSLAVHAFNYQLFFDEATYNPCQKDSNSYFYPHPTDNHQYYQCDESGNAYLRSCGALVWDALRTACNWPDIVDVSSTASSTSRTLATTASSTTTASISVSSLCSPINPCGEHGKCIESPPTVSISRRRFACICAENWVGRLCDKQTDELTTPPLSLDQIKNETQSRNTFSLPVYTKEDSNYIFYGLKGDNKIEASVRLRKRNINKIQRN
ncbi:hypothetical protein I4U23_008303 [Adineta vaga]|nr:hypothetical protein I4U23_008303 [Adineta vaga]